MDRKSWLNVVPFLSQSKFGTGSDYKYFLAEAKSGCLIDHGHDYFVRF